MYARTLHSHKKTVVDKTQDRGTWQIGVSWWKLCDPDPETTRRVQGRPVSGVGWREVQATEDDGPFLGQTPGESPPLSQVPPSESPPLSHRFLSVDHHFRVASLVSQVRVCWSSFQTVWVTLYVKVKVCSVGDWVMDAMHYSQPYAATGTELWSSTVCSVACWTLHGSYKNSEGIMCVSILHNRMGIPPVPVAWQGVSEYSTVRMGFPVHNTTPVAWQGVTIQHL